MAAVSLLGSTINTTAGAKTVAATPAVGDLILLWCVVSDDSTWGPPTDDNSSGTYTQVGTSFSTAGSKTGKLYIRDSLISSATSTVFTLSNPSADTGGGLAVVKVTGMSKAGSSAVRQTKQSTSGAGATPQTGTWASSKLTTNPVIGVAANGTNPATLTPTAGFSELLDTGYATPDTGVFIQYVNSGDTTNTMTLGGTSATACGIIGVELDASSSDTSSFFLALF